MFSIKVGQIEFTPKGVFSNHFSHNLGKNHETYIEYVDNREITLPLTANFNEIKPTVGKTPHFGLFGNWNGKGIYERGFCREEQKRIRREKKIKLSPTEQNILRNREYYYGNTQKRR